MLHVATTGTDADWVIKLIDVYPGDFPNPNPNPANAKLGGAQQLVRGDVFRGKFRNSFEKPEPFTPGQPAKIAFAIPDVCHTFRRGHRVMLHLQSRGSTCRVATSQFCHPMRFAPTCPTWCWCCLGISRARCESS